MDNESKLCLSHEEEIKHLPTNSLDTLFPTTFHGKATLRGYYHEGQGNCPSISMNTKVKITLHVTEPTKGHLSVSYLTYDSLGNVKDTSSSKMESPVNLRPSKPIFVADESGRDYFRFYYSTLAGSRAQMKINCTDRYKVIVNGETCYDLSNSSTFSLSLSQITRDEESSKNAEIRIE